MNGNGITGNMAYAIADTRPTALIRVACPTRRALPYANDYALTGLFRRHCEGCEAVRSNPAETRPYTRLLRRYTPRNDGGSPERAIINSVGQRPTFAVNHTICRLKACYHSYGASPRNADTRPTALNFFCVPFRRAAPYVRGESSYCRLKAYYPSYGASPRNTDTRPTALNFFCVPFRRALPYANDYALSGLFRRHCEDYEAVRSNPAETRPYTRLLRRYVPRNDGGSFCVPFRRALPYANDYALSGLCIGYDDEKGALPDGVSRQFGMGNRGVKTCSDTNPFRGCFILFHNDGSHAIGQK